MSEEMFGPAESGEWGSSPAGEPAVEGESMFRDMQDLGDGMFIKLDPAVFEGLMRTSAAEAMVRARAQQVVEAANSMHITKGAVYEYVWMDNPGPRPQALVKPANYKAAIDLWYHDTLIKAALAVGSDPKLPEGEFPEAQGA